MNKLWDSKPKFQLQNSSTSGLLDIKVDTHKRRFESLNTRRTGKKLFSYKTEVQLPKCHSPTKPPSRLP